MKTIIVPIVNRTNYSKLKLLLQYIKKDFNVKVVLSSSILLRRYGDPCLDVTNDGHTILDSIDCLFMNDSLESMVKTCAMSMYEHSHTYKQNKCDAVLAVGDRYDMLSPVLAARMMNIPVLHIQGGEKSSSVDETVRNIITICSSQHFVSTQNSVERVKSLGIPEKDIFNFGCPALEYISKINVGNKLDVTTFKKKYKHDIPISQDDPYLLILVHPVTTNKDDVNMKVIIDASMTFKMKTIILYPNSDAYNNTIVSAISSFSGNIIPIKHCPLEDFIKLMAHCKCFIGNSSSGIREAALFGTPVVNIGERQSGRERNSNTVDVQCDYEQIIEAIQASIVISKYPCGSVYFKENCCTNISYTIKRFLEG